MTHWVLIEAGRPELLGHAVIGPFGTAGQADRHLRDSLQVQGMCEDDAVDAGTADGPRMHAAVERWDAAGEQWHMYRPVADAEHQVLGAAAIPAAQLGETRAQQWRRALQAASLYVDGAPPGREAMTVFLTAAEITDHLDAERHGPLGPAAAAAALFGDPWFAADVGPRLTCDEADTIAAWLREARGEAAAAAWLHGHADGDTGPGDRHRAAAPRPPAAATAARRHQTGPRPVR